MRFTPQMLQCKNYFLPVFSCRHGEFFDGMGLLKEPFCVLPKDGRDLHADLGGGLACSVNNAAQRRLIDADRFSQRILSYPAAVHRQLQIWI